MTKRQAFISLAILVFGIIVIPFVVSYNGHQNIAIAIFAVSFVTFCHWPKKKAT